jgi:hypothetical protein
MLCPICKKGNSKELINYTTKMDKNNNLVKIKIYYYLCDTNGCKFMDKELTEKNLNEKNKVLGIQNE